MPIRIRKKPMLPAATAFNCNGAIRAEVYAPKKPHKKNPPMMSQNASRGKL